MNSRTATIVVILVFALGVVVFLFTSGDRFELPEGETRAVEDLSEVSDEGTTPATTGRTNEVRSDDKSTVTSSSVNVRGQSEREIFETDGTIHSIPLDEILSGGPPKDGIPSIDDPKFTSTKEADEFLDDESVGLGLVWKGEARFYPYAILVWHELVNDTVAGDPLLVTYCPLCATGIVFDRRVNGEAEEFGVSGFLWKSNLLMYNRASNPDDESLWSQVLGEAVLGVETGERLGIVRSDTVRYGDWKRDHPDTVVLSRETGALRSYGVDPYGDYYVNESVSFGASFNDDRLHPKTFVFGIEVSGQFKAYDQDALRVGITVDQFAGEVITIERTSGDEIDFFIGEDKRELETIDGFWFSWLAVHPETELFQ